MRYTQNNNVYESTAQYATDWTSTNWYKVEKYVDKLQKRIYHAESIGELNFRIKFCSSRMFG